ncbi:hypothetical protein AB6N24_17830 [Cellulomonas sp. 179-A 4D5 NHS]|uniref:hypothetical protein n=1 Tax=Cellulomonas sp. 179-A 4D5 NHS TaxID=3142378 RepID=UPI0039A13E6A
MPDDDHPSLARDVLPWFSRLPAEQLSALSDQMTQLRVLHDEQQLHCDAVALEMQVLDFSSPERFQAGWRSIAGHHEEIARRHAQLAELARGIAEGAF